MLYNILLWLLRKKGGADMAIIYAYLIIKGLKTLEQVPERIREQVRQVLIDMDIDV